VWLAAQTQQKNKLLSDINLETLVIELVNYTIFLVIQIRVWLVITKLKLIANYIPINHYTLFNKLYKKSIAREV